MIRLLLVDDQSLIRRGLKALLKGEENLQIVGEADNGEAALELIESLQPDVVLMDVRMPIMDGVAATRIISERFPQTRVLILTTFDDNQYVAQAMQHGAAGYLLKDTPLDELVQGIQAVHRGYVQLGPGLARNLHIQAPAPPPILPPGWTELTPREQEILQLIATGISNQEIAQALYITEKTVKNHVTSILSRLNVRDRTQAAILFHSLRSKS